MQIEQTILPDGLRFSIRGSLSGTESSTILLFETVSIAIDKNPQRIILDLAKTIYVDSMSIGIIVGILLKCQEKGIAFRFENMNPDVTKIFDSTRLKKAFPELY